VGQASCHCGYCAADSQDEASNIYGIWREPWASDTWAEQEPEPEVPDNHQLMAMDPEAASPAWKAGEQGQARGT